MHTRALFTEEKVPVRTYVAIIVSFASIVLVFASALDGDGLLGEREPVCAHFLPSYFSCSFFFEMFYFTLLQLLYGLFIYNL
jgi:hypothetical protein